MKITILAARMQRAIEEIQRKTGIDISPGRFGRMPDTKHLQLMQLETIANELPNLYNAITSDDSQDEDLANVHAIIMFLADIKGVGPKLHQTIATALIDEFLG